MIIVITCGRIGSAYVMGTHLIIQLLD